MPHGRGLPVRQSRSRGAPLGRCQRWRMRVRYEQQTWSDQRTLKNSIRATGVGLHTGKKVLMTLQPGAAGHGHRVPSHRSGAPGRHPRARRERRRHHARHHSRQGGVARLHRRAPAVGIRRSRHRQCHRRGDRPPRCRSWTAAPAPSCSCCSRPASRSSGAQALHPCEEAAAGRGRRQVGAVRSVRRLQGELRDRVQSPDLQAPLAARLAWTSPPPRSSRK